MDMTTYKLVTKEIIKKQHLNIMNSHFVYCLNPSNNNKSKFTFQSSHAFFINVTSLLCPASRKGPKFELLLQIHLEMKSRPSCSRQLRWHIADGGVQVFQGRHRDGERGWARDWHLRLSSGDRLSQERGTIHCIFSGFPTWQRRTCPSSTPPPATNWGASPPRCIWIIPWIKPNTGAWLDWSRSNETGMKWFLL